MSIISNKKYKKVLTLFAKYPQQYYTFKKGYVYDAYLSAPNFFEEEILSYIC